MSEYQHMSDEELRKIKKNIKTLQQNRAWESKEMDLACTLVDGHVPALLAEIRALREEKEVAVDLAIENMDEVCIADIQGVSWSPNGDNLVNESLLKTNLEARIRERVEKKGETNAE